MGFCVGGVLNMSQSFAMIFPGQGSQSVGMLRELSDIFPEIKLTFEKASRVLGYDLWELTQSGPAEKLNQTIYTQPALLAADIAVWHCWKKLNGPTPAYLAGHSLGEYAALVVADALQFEDAVALVSDRGKFMQAAVSEDKGAMAAIIGLDDQMVLALCKEASSIGVVSPANYNSIGQVVISGEKPAVLKAMQLAENRGARMTKIIPVSVPSHCALMQSAADHLAQKLKQVTFSQPVIHVIQNRDAIPHHSSEKILENLIQQLVHPVRWTDTIQMMLSKSIRHIIECGPGRVLSGLNKRISRDIHVYTLQTETEIQQAIQALGA